MDKEVVISVTYEIMERAEGTDGRHSAKNNREDFLCIKCQIEWAR